MLDVGDLTPGFVREGSDGERSLDDCSVNRPAVLFLRGDL